MKFARRIGYSLLNEITLLPFLILSYIAYVVATWLLSAFGIYFPEPLIIFLGILLSDMDIFEIISEPSYVLSFVPFFFFILLIRSLIYRFTYRELFGSNIILRRIGQDDEKCKFGRLFLRTFLKYLSLFFFPPILLFPLFNKQRLFFHEWASGVRKCEGEILFKKTSKKMQFINDEEKKFYKEQSENQC